jgi:hypothetical protein
MDLSGIDLGSIGNALRLFRDAVRVVKDIKGVLPASQQEAVSRSLDEADNAARIAEAEIARSMGYRLCQCTFPPQIMLKPADQGDARGHMVTCPNCRAQQHVDLTDRHLLAGPRR